MRHNVTHSASLHTFASADLLTQSMLLRINEVFTILPVGAVVKQAIFVVQPCLPAVVITHSCLIGCMLTDLCMKVLRP